jgi:hypothetical protein
MECKVAGKKVGPAGDERVLPNDRIVERQHRN